MSTALLDRGADLDPPDRIIVRHTVRVGPLVYSFYLVAPKALGRRAVSEALRDAVAELRAINAAVNPARRASLLSESGPVTGWAIERAAARLRSAGVTDYAVTGGTHLAVHGRAPHGGAWL
jgi:FAD:protein FMN transferase